MSPELSAPAPLPAVFRPVVKAVRKVLLGVGALSLFLNLLVLVSPLYMLQVFDRVLSSGSVSTLISLTLIAAFAIACMTLMDIYRQQVLTRLGQWMEREMVPHVLNASVIATSRGQGVGAQPLRDLGGLRSFVGGAAIVPLFDIPWLPIFTMVIWLMHPALGLLTVLTSVVLLGLAFLNEKMTRRRTQAASRASVVATADVDAGLRNSDVLRGMGMLPAWRQRTLEQAKAIAGESQELDDLSSWLLGVSRFLRYFIQVAVMGLGAYLVLQSDLTGGAIAAASILFGRAVAPVERSIEMWKSFLAARSAYDRLARLLGSYENDADKMLLPEPKGRLAVENLTYYAPGTKAPVLRGLNFQIEPGQALCLVGPSGSGKTTLCRLLTGIINPNNGHVRLDGAEIGQWNEEMFSKYLGYMPQDVELFSGTVRENIARLTEPDDEAVLEAAKLADVHDMIVRLPDGYAADIGPNGARLSAGQRQRLGLARALYGSPKLVVLDEPNANLDSDGELALIATLGTLRAAGVTVVMVTHRPSLMTYIDKMLVLRDGQQMFFGNRDDILQQLTRQPGRLKGAQPMEELPV